MAGRGGMGVVYRATHLALDHTVALKVIAGELATDARFRERFVRESRTAVSVRHPNVVQVRHAGEEDGVLFVTMDYVEGTDLRGLLEAEGALAPDRGTMIVAQVAAALDAAHERGLVHRDVKPGNVLIERRGEREHVYLTDFGLTKRMSGATELTASGAFIGTIEYMAPEQIRGRELDARTDVYALGGVAFAALTGSAPFGHVTEDIAKMYAHLNDPVPSVRERISSLPPALDSVIAKAMAKEPNERYSSAGEMARALAAAVGGATVEETRAAALLAPEPTDPTEEEAPQPAPTEAFTPPFEPVGDEPPVRSQRLQRRRRALGALAGLAVAALALGAFALLDGEEGPPGSESVGSPAGALVGSSIDIGEFSAGVAAGPSGTQAEGKVLVADREGGTVAVIDEASGTIGETMQVGPQPESVFVGDPLVWVVRRGTSEVLRFDGPAGNQLEPVVAGTEPRDVTVFNATAWITNSGDGTVTRLEPNGTLADEPIPVGQSPYGVATAGDLVFVVNRGSDSVSVLDRIDADSLNSTTPIAEIPVGKRPKSVTVGAGSAWVTNTDDDTVTRLDAVAPQGSEPTTIRGDFAQPRDVAFGFGAVWVTNGGDEDVGGSVTRIDPETERTRLIELGGSPEGIAVGSEAVWVALGQGGEVVAIEPG